MNKYKFYYNEEVMEIPDYNKLKNHLKKGDKFKDAFFKDIVILYNIKNALDEFVELGLVVAKGEDPIADEHYALVKRLKKDFPEIKEYIDKVLEPKRKTIK